MSRDGGASPVDVAELFALNGVLRVDGASSSHSSCSYSSSSSSSRSFQLPEGSTRSSSQVAGVPSPVPAIAGPFVEELDLHCLLVPWRVLKQLLLPSSSQIVAKGRGDGWKKIDDAFGLRHRNDNFLVEPALKDVEGETRLLPRCFWHSLQLAVGAVERSFDL